MDDFMIDSYCTKMTQSIILEEQSPETVSDTKVLNEPSAALSAKSFHRLKRLGAGKYGEVFLAM